MVHRWFAMVLIGCSMAGAAPAQAAAWRFHWQAGQVLNYRIEQVTTASEVVEGKTSLTTSKLSNTKHWKVLDVDAAGVATLELSLRALRVETTAPGGEVMLFDSANREGSNPQMREQLAKYVGQPLAVLRIDGQGKVVEVKQSKYGPASRYESEPPFVITLPDAEGQVGHTWQRTYQIVVEPPEGAGEKYDALQKYTCQALDGSATIAVATSIAKLPESALDQIPLLQMQPTGEVVFDVQSGRLQRAALQVAKEIKGHQGEGSSYQFKSTYVEQYIADN